MDPSPSPRTSPDRVEHLNSAYEKLCAEENAARRTAPWLFPHAPIEGGWPTPRKPVNPKHAVAAMRFYGIECDWNLTHVFITDRRCPDELVGRNSRAIQLDASGMVGYTEFLIMQSAVLIILRPEEYKTRG